jgi:hypothetical protein
MASIALSASLTPSSSSDVVGVFSESFVQVFRFARPIKVSINPTSKSMDQPLESAATISDHRIILPLEIEVFFIIPSSAYRFTYDEIRQAFDSAESLIVQTRTGIYSDLFIDSMPSDEDPDQYDIIKISIKFKEVKFAKPSFAPAPEKKTSESTKSRGNISSSERDSSQLSRLNKYL